MISKTEKYSIEGSEYKCTECASMSLEEAKILRKPTIACIIAGSIDQIGADESFLERAYGLSYGIGFQPKKGARNDPGENC